MTRKKEDKISKPDGKLEKSVILVGMMGAGKSSIGKMLAAHISARFIDSDTEIEKAAKMTIPEIFKLHGEASFRDGEKRVFNRLLEGPPAIIAAGGGAFAHAGRTQSHHTTPSAGRRSFHTHPHPLYARGRATHEQRLCCHDRRRLSAAARCANVRGSHARATRGATWMP